MTPEVTNESSFMGWLTSNHSLFYLIRSKQTEDTLALCNVFIRAVLVSMLILSHSGC